jgi:hypothetical protein
MRSNRINRPGRRQLWKPRAQAARTTSDLIDQTSPAFRVVQKGGGLSKFAADFDFPTSTVHSWLTKRNGRGGAASSRPDPLLRGAGPHDQLSGVDHVIAAASSSRPIEYVPEDFVETEEAL